MNASKTDFLYEKELYDKWGGFYLSYKICSDCDSVIQHLKNGGIKVAYLPSVVMKVRVGGASNNSLGDLFRKLKEEIFILRKNNIFLLVAIILKRASRVARFVFE